MRTNKHSYYPTLHEKTPQSVIREASRGIKEITRQIHTGGIKTSTVERKILSNAYQFILEYSKESKALADGEQWSNALARKRLTIILWWFKCLTRPDRRIEQIRNVYEGCTTDPKILSQIIGIPADQIAEPLPYIVAEPCHICGGTHYTLDGYNCIDCIEWTKQRQIEIAKTGKGKKVFRATKDAKRKAREAALANIDSPYL